MTREIDISGLSVMIAMPVHRDIPADTVISLLATATQLQASNIKYVTHLQIGSSLVEVARTKCAHDFLQGECNRIFWIDSDIKWEADSFFRLLALSTQYDVIGALYPYKEDPPLIGFNFDEGRFPADSNGCFAVHGLGLGFVCMQRHIIEKLAAKAPMLTFAKVPDPMPHIFRCDSIDGVFRGEDVALCADIRALGYQIMIDPTITLGHVGSKTYTARMIDFLEKES
jgi:hypothetical protein